MPVSKRVIFFLSGRAAVLCAVADCGSVAFSVQLSTSIVFRG